MRARIAGGLFACALGLGLGFGCSGNEAPRRGQVMLAFQTDMEVPKDINRVFLQIKVQGAVKFSQEYDVGPDSHVRLPATFAIVAPEGGSPTVSVKLVGLAGVKPRTLRQVITTVPKERIALLRMPIEFLCDESAQKLSDQEYETTCPQKGTSCSVGDCVADVVPVESLPSYAAPEVFGGGDVAGSGSCFDTLACFEKGSGVQLDSADCSAAAVTTDAGDLGLSYALLRGPNSEGICGPKACLVPLDKDTGWKEENGRVKFPAAVCKKISEGKVQAVVMTRTCVSKEAKLPTCGPWSSVQPDAGTFDAGAPDASSVVPEGGSQDDSASDAPDCAALQQAVDAKKALANSCAGMAAFAACGTVQGPCGPIVVGDPTSQATIDLVAAVTALQNSGCTLHCSGADGGGVQDGGAVTATCMPDTQVCGTSSCSDGVWDSFESDIDCGGSCSPCNVGRTCTQGSDCRSSSCVGGTCACQAPLVVVQDASSLQAAFCIMPYEVTSGAYQAWLPNAPNPQAQAPECSLNVDFTPQYAWPPSDTILPVVGVDWCDAVAFCEGNGMRLCGARGGGASPFTSFDQFSVSQWFDACSVNGTTTYGVASDPLVSGCNGPAGPGPQHGAMLACSTVQGVYNLSGNVAEWEDSCNGSSGPPDSCHIRGGSYQSATASELACAAQAASPRDTASPFVGFRCCDDDGAFSGGTN